MIKENFKKKLIQYNLPILRQRNKKIKLEIKSGEAETIKITTKATKIIILETIEHVRNEEEAIINLKKNLKNKGQIYVSVPVEFGIMFFFKDLGRRFIRKKEFHNLKELFYGLIGKTSKINRSQRQHKGYDYRNTIKIFEKHGFKKKYEKGYPFNNCFFAYGKILVFEK